MTILKTAAPVAPAITLTVVVTLLAGIFGAIPAAIHTDRALQIGEPTTKYWTAFFLVLGVQVVIALMFAMTL